MASIPPPSPLNFCDENKKLDLNSVHELISIIHTHILTILNSPQSQKSLKSKCNFDFFEFPHHPILSNLYHGIENTESAADKSITAHEKSIFLENAEKMLQIPASMDENGATSGVSNSYLICISYFYLSIVELLRNNEWQMAMHFLQAILISPRAVYTHFAPGICHSFLGLYFRHKNENFCVDRDEKTVENVMKWIARRYKPWLTYYQIMSSVDFRDQAENKFEESKSSIGNGIGLKSNVKCLRDILTESDSQPETPVSLHSYESSSEDEDFRQSYAEDTVTSFRTRRNIAENLNQSSWDLKAPERTLSTFHTSKHRLKVDQAKALDCISRSFSTSFCGTDLSKLRLTKTRQYLDDYINEDDKLDNIGSIALTNHEFPRPIHRKNPSRMKKSSSFHLQHDEKRILDQSGLLEKMISNLCFTNELSPYCEDDYTVEMKTIYEILNSKSGLKYTLLKDIILDQLLSAISTSNEERVIRTSLAILTTIVVENRSVVEDIKKKGLRLYDLANALKKNVHEAVILIYLINPSPIEIKTLELLPFLVEVVCTSKSYKVDLSSLVLTPPSASLMIIEVLVSSFDYETNSAHLETISSPRVLSGLVQVPRKDHLEEFVSLASILVKCMRFDGKCRKYVSEFCPVAPFVALLWSNEERATSVALEFFNELLRIPRSSAIGLLEQIRKHGSTNNLCALFLLTQNSKPEYKLLAANLLLQLEVLEDKSAKCIYREKATKALLEALPCEESQAIQALSTFVLSNLAGTYSWTGEPYTAVWLVKKTGLTLGHHRNYIKSFDFFDPCLQDGGIDSWCSKMAQRLLILGTPVFHALNKGLNSTLKRVSRDCLIATAWLGFELVKGPEELRNAACEIILHSIEQYVHPGLELEERLLACLCIYNFTSGRGMKKIVNLSEGVRESLRRLSNVTWMAEELLKVADYFQPNKWRISCVHSQILETGNKSSGAVTALIFYKGQLYGGYTNGSIKVWDINGHKATLVREIKDHKKVVTCFALYEPENCLLSGSADKTIKIWQMLQRNLECVEVIPTKESVRSIDSCGEMIFWTTQSHKLKVIDASSKTKDVFKNKRVKCVKVSNGKVYAGCTDSSIQELMITNNRHQEIKAASKSWMQNKPISSVSIYKDWLYSASLLIEGSKTKDWRKSNKPQISITPEKGASVLAMEVVEDFVYLNCSTSINSIQIWLRGTQHKVGRLSAGSKITSLLTANDMILCGTEKGIIKGWIPL